MTDPITLDLVTPEKRVCQDPYTMIVLPGAEGEVGILSQHQPIILTLKAGQPDLTPNVAAPYLRMLVRDNPDTAFARTWKYLQMPKPPVDWVCGTCGRADERVRWFCPDCRSFRSHRRGTRAREGA